MMGRRTRIGLGLLAAIGATAAAAAPQDGAAAGRHEYRQVVMGVEARVVLVAEDEARARTAARDVFARLDSIDAALSDWRDDGPVSAVEAAAGGDAVSVPHDLAVAAAAARRFAARTGGAFDPTVGPVTRLWRAARESGELPDAVALAAAAALVDWRALEADPARDTLRLARAGMQLDLGGIGKGFALDRCAPVLATHGIDAWLLDLGGDLLAGAAPPGADGWRAVATSGEPGGPGRELVIAREAVATSGATYQHLEVDGVRHSHLLDPETGAATTDGATVVVRAPTAAEADALATAIAASGPHAGRALARAVAPNARFWIDRPGFEPLFDGETLAGWRTTGGRYDGAARWSVEDGALVGRTGPAGEGGLLYTSDRHTAFELQLEVAIDHPFDSGIFLRMLPPDTGLKGLQVTLDHRPDGEIGGLYADGWLEHVPDGERHFERGAWNHVCVRSAGFDPRVRVWVNGVLTTDFALPAGTPGYAPHGRIGLQVHGADAGAATRSVRFRDVRLKRLPVLADESLAPVDGWSDVLAGGLDGLAFQGGREGYAIEDGALAIPSEGAGHVATRTDHRDYLLRLDVALEPAANSGLYLRSARAGGNPSYEGAEVQLIDDDGWQAAYGAPLQPTQTTGSLYGAIAAPEWKRLHPPGEWNTIEVLYRGTRLAVALNGLTLYDVDTLALEADPPFADRPGVGFVGLQRYGAPAVEGEVALRVRDWFVRELLR